MFKSILCRMALEVMSIMVVHWLHLPAQRVWIGLFLVSLSEGLTTCVGSAYYLLFEKYSVFGLYNSAHSLCKKLRTHWWSSWIVVELSCTTLTQPLIATSMNFRYTCEDQQFSSCWLHALFRGWTLACLQFGNLSYLGGSDTARPAQQYSLWIMGETESHWSLCALSSYLASWLLLWRMRLGCPV